MAWLGGSCRDEPPDPDEARKLPATADPFQPIAEAQQDRPFVVAQLGQSLDGRIALASGESRWINGAAALDHVHRLRASVDAVVVGVGTVIADDPLLNVRRVAGPSPVRVVIDPAGRVPAHARCLADDGARRIVIGAEQCAGAALPPGVEHLTLRAETGGISPGAIVDALFRRGLSRLLVEGGAHTVSRFVEAGAVDRLHLLVGPMILGSGKPGLTLAPIGRLSEALRPTVRAHVLAGGDVLFDCDLRQQPLED
jgi:riboflavin-specific deaminase-like protein